MPQVDTSYLSGQAFTVSELLAQPLPVEHVTYAHTDGRSGRVHRQYTLWRPTDPPLSEYLMHPCPVCTGSPVQEFRLQPHSDYECRHHIPVGGSYWHFGPLPTPPRPITDPSLFAGLGHPFASYCDVRIAGAALPASVSSEWRFGGLSCTRTPRHDGPHVAHRTDGTYIHHWESPDVSTAAPRYDVATDTMSTDTMSTGPTPGTATATPPRYTRESRLSQRCDAIRSSTGGHTCTRTYGHSGRHAAVALGDTLIVDWPASTTATRPAPVPTPAYVEFGQCGRQAHTEDGYICTRAVHPASPVHVAHSGTDQPLAVWTTRGDYRTLSASTLPSYFADLERAALTDTPPPPVALSPMPGPGRDDNRCRQAAPIGAYVCTRPTHPHSPVHVAHSSGRPLAVWTGEPHSGERGDYITVDIHATTLDPYFSALETGSPIPPEDLTMPILSAPLRKLSALTFGVEIECTIPNASMDREGWRVGDYHAGFCVSAPFRGWKVQSDGSINANYPYIAAEVVSPILKGAKGLASVVAMVEHLKGMGARINRSCGFHVHVGWSGDAAALRRLICFVSHHEAALYAMTGTHDREANQFCTSIKTAYRGLQGMTRMADIVNAHMGRYHVLNLTNLAAHETGRGEKRTVEFRVFAGTLNTVKIAAYVQLCLGMVQRALDSRQAMPWDAVLTDPQKAKARTTPGTVAVSRLLAHLQWYRDSAKTDPIGVFDRDTTPALMAMVRKMALKYDGRNRTADHTEVTS